MVTRSSKATHQRPYYRVYFIVTAMMWWWWNVIRLLCGLVNITFQSFRIEPSGRGQKGVPLPSSGHVVFWKCTGKPSSTHNTLLQNSRSRIKKNLFSLNFLLTNWILNKCERESSLYISAYTVKHNIHISITLGIS